MKLAAAIIVLGIGTTATALTTYLGVTPTIELQLLLFINVSVLTAILLRKYMDVSTWLFPGRQAKALVRKPFSNTSWFVTNRLGLKKLTPEEECTKREMEEQEMEEGTGNGDIGEIVPVVEPIVPPGLGGTVKYKGKKWPARSSQTIAPGENARIIGRDILILEVEKIKQNSTVEKGFYY